MATQRNNNLIIRFALMEADMKYYELDKILGISEPTRCRMLRQELPKEEQNRIVNLIREHKREAV